MESLIETTGTLPKFNGVVLVFGEELMQFLEDSYCVELIWIEFTVKDFLCSMNGISNLNMLFLLHAWLILHLMAKSSALVLMT